MGFFARSKQVPVQLSSNSESGAACIAMIASWFGNNVDVPTMRRRFPDTIRGEVKPEDLLESARGLGLSARIVNCVPSELKDLHLPCIVRYEFNKYLVLEKLGRTRVRLIHNIHGRIESSIYAFAENYSGVALELTPDASFKKQKPEHNPGLWQLLSFSPKAKSLVAQSIALSLFLQALVLLMPLNMQLVIDEVIAANDKDLLSMLAISFGAIVIFNAVGTYVRGMLFQMLSIRVARDVSFKLHHHLFSLPLQYFQSRGTGDVFQRFRGVELVRSYLNGSFIGTFVDGILALFTCALMIAYSPLLGGTVVIFSLVYIAIRLKTNPIRRGLFTEFCENDGKEASYFVESLRGVLSIKTLNMLPQREPVWQNLYAERLNSAMRWQSTDVIFNGASVLISGVSDVLLLFLAARFVLDGTMTIGVMAAFLAYKTQFMTRIFSSVDQYSQFKILEGLSTRVTDIAFSDPEPAAKRVVNSEKEMMGKIEFRDVSFRYAQTGPMVLDAINITIAPGEFVAIIGPSGCGKSTMAKLLLGLYQPESGEILIDDMPQSMIGPNYIRKHAGPVMTEDVIFSGSIAENISLFEENYEEEWMQQCAKLAHIHSTIMELPDQYQTLVGETGLILSSGQKQRLLIARALYKRPDVLIMDEGTTNLDPATEREIVSALRSINMTRFMIAHSSKVAAAADKVYDLSMGKLRISNLSSTFDPAVQQ